MICEDLGRKATKRGQHVSLKGFSFVSRAKNEKWCDLQLLSEITFVSPWLITLVPEAFFYSLLANFATRTASYIFFYWLGASISASSRKFPNEKR